MQERSKVLLNNIFDESWLAQLEKSISRDALEIYSLRENQIKVLIKNLNTINQLLINSSNKYILLTGSLYLIGKIRKKYL